ncbi:MAG: tyrosine-type recombinase/integrase [Rhodobacter sp.]|nr:tyrosine-type recombinase/integrase [Rhodobacter sp.]
MLLFRKRSGSKIIAIRMQTQFPAGAPVPFALYQERERLLAAPAPVVHGSTVAHVIDRYERSPEFTGLAPRTKADYRKHLGFLADKIGHLEPKNIERHHVIAWRDAWAKKSPHRANYRLRVLRIIMERAIDFGLLPTGGNRVKDVSEVKYEKQERQPWPDVLVAAARRSADGRTVLLFELLIGTGQRIGDVLKMKWSDFDGEAISVRQGKTRTKLWIPAPRKLLKALGGAPRRSVFILTNHAGTGPWSYRGAADAMMKLRRQVGAEAFDIHSLRYTATAELARVGLGDDQIMAITGHKTQRMVQLYAGAERQKARARAANIARERNINET